MAPRQPHPLKSNPWSCKNKKNLQHRLQQRSVVLIVRIEEKEVLDFDIADDKGAF